MRNRISIFCVAVCAALLAAGCSSRSRDAASKTAYKDGVYEGQSQAGYTSEPFWGQVKITINNGEISDLDFKIQDVLKNQIFDQDYEKNYTGNDTYIQQCRENWKWLQKYPQMLVNTQSLEKVDSVSGATWARNLFISTVKKTLAKAEHGK